MFKALSEGLSYRHVMKDIPGVNFGVLIAFWLPGFLFLRGLSYSWPEIATWLPKSGGEAATVGGFLNVSLASLAVGLLINAIRWAIVQEVLLYGVGRLQRRTINYHKLTNKDVYTAFQGAIENNYRYYQYYANAFVAIVAAFTSYAVYHVASLWTWVLAISIAIILLIAAYNELNVFNQRAAEITG